VDLSSVSVSLNLNTISISLSIICSGIVIARTVLKPLKKILTLQEYQNDGIKCLLRKDILELVTCVNERGFIYDDELEVLRKLYINYTKLKGNGIVKKAVEKVFELPIKNR
jgi:hypothetical protein